MKPSLFTLTISAGAVAWYGAILATVGTFVQLLNFLRDRKSVMIKLKRDMEMLGEGLGPYVGKTIALVTVVNVGRRPLTISTIGLQYDDGVGAIFTDTRPLVPSEIREGQSIQALFDEAGVRFDRILWYEASDVSGTSFRLNIASPFKRFKWRIRRVMGRVPSPALSGVRDN